jgi:hypothetical protein
MTFLCEPIKEQYVLTLLFAIDNLNSHERTNVMSQLILLTAKQHNINEAYFLLTLLKEKKQ